MAKDYSPTITSYDLLKTVAVMTMVIDHMGFYFDPHDMWWRTIGRLSAPIWFFLIGYARSRDFSMKMWGGAVILLAASMATGMFIFPLNALFAMLFIRAILNPLMKVATRNAETLTAISIGLLVLSIPSYSIMEYGIQGLLMAMFGYIIRNRPVVGDIRSPKSLPRAFGLFTLAHYILLQGIIFKFTPAQIIVMSAGLGPVFIALYHFRLADYPVLTQKLPDFAVKGLRVLGHRTLEIYVAHLILFKIFTLIVDPARYTPFHWTWMI
jgi:hypothetical protein